MTSPAAKVGQQVMGQLGPPPALTVSQWADRERRLPRESSAEPGQWRTDRAPYQRGIMDALNDPSIETIVVQSSSQVGKTEILLNILGYHIALDPCPIMMVQPTLDLADAISKDRLAPMIRDTPALHSKVGDAKERDAANTTRHKTFPGGHLTLAGANSAASLASRPIRLVLADEVDRYPPHLGDEGDPLALAIKRTATFWNRKILIVSTPTVTGTSRIESWFEESDQRRFVVPCPRCGAPHELEWKNVVWEGEASETAHLVCPACGGRIEDRERLAMVRAGDWRASAPFLGIAGFFIWECYSPWRRLAQIVDDFLKARRSPEKLRVFINTSLGQSWEEEGMQADQHVLLARREPYAKEVPAGVCCLTASVDTQDDRLEVLVAGWGLGEESWIVDRRTLPGDPSRPEPWAALDEVLALPYEHTSGARLPILATCVDSAGHRTDYVYDYARRNQHLRVYAVIGRDGQRPVVSEPSEKRTGRNPRPVVLYTVGVDVCKALIASRLNQVARGPGFVHFPLGHAGVDEEFFAQLTAERLVTKYSKGVKTRKWIQTRPRNEALDLFVMALAALRILNPRLQAMAERLAAATPPPPPAPGPDAQPSSAFTVPQPMAPPLTGQIGGRRFSRSSYLSGR